LRNFPPLPPYDSTDFGRTAATCAPPGVQLTGSQYYAIGGDQQVNGTQVAVLSNVDTAAYLIYALPATGLSNEVIAATAGTARPTGYWVGLSDYASGRWRWLAPQSTFNFSQPCPPGNQRADGTTFVAFVVFGGANVAIGQVSRSGMELGDTPPPDAQALTVGEGKTYATVEDAYAAAPASGGATILIYPQAGKVPYSQPHLQVYKPGIIFWGIPSPPDLQVTLDGTGYNYTGAGAVPRAIFQFNPGADGCTVRGLNLFGAHNDTFNGAGVRINQANHVSVIDCTISNCDMGMMSNGDASAAVPTGADQWVAYCAVYSNGNLSDPGYNHNFYLGGTSVTLHACEVYGSLTGHNVKSRAHFNRIEYCYVHDSANREFDLVDGVQDTVPADSNSVLLGNVIVKDPAVPGNRNVIHFGQDGGNDHNGILFLVNNTIVTPFASPVVILSDASCRAILINNVIVNKEQAAPSLVDVANGASLSDASGSNNWLSKGYSIAGTGIDSKTTKFGAARSEWPFTGSDYVLAPLELKPASFPSLQRPAKRYVGNEKWLPSTAIFLGAG
jgi:hypothetical protein